MECGQDHIEFRARCRRVDDCWGRGSFEWRPKGGDPRGYIFWDDEASGQDAYWQAPTKFEGDLSGFKRGALTFD